MIFFALCSIVFFECCVFYVEMILILFIYVILVIETSFCVIFVYSILFYTFL